MTNVETTDTAANVAEQGAHVAPEKAFSKKQATRQKGAPKGQKAANAAKAKVTAKKKAKGGKKPAKAAAAKTTMPRAESKAAKVVAMISRPKGATLAEIMKATGWQPHTVRGFISGTVTKKMGLAVESDKNDAGDRVYKVAS